MKKIASRNNLSFGGITFTITELEVLSALIYNCVIGNSKYESSVSTICDKIEEYIDDKNFMLSASLTVPMKVLVMDTNGYTVSTHGIDSFKIKLS